MVDIGGEYKNKQLKSLRSARTRETHLEWWDSKIGQLKLHEVLPAYVSDCLRELEEPDAEDNVRSPGTINRYHSSIGEISTHPRTLSHRRLFVR